jgi:anti-anti-sigma factor
MQKTTAMISQPLAARVRHQSGVPVIELHGEIDASSDAVLQAAYREAARDNASHMILLNCSGVGHLRRRGLALLVSLMAQARKAQQQLMICGLNEHDREIFSITRLGDFMQVFADEAQALAAQASL